MDPVPALIIRGASSMRRIDKLFKYISPKTHQIRVDVNTPLNQACDIAVQMQAGLRGPDAFKVFNPEVVRLKVEASEAISVAVARMLKFEISVLEKIDRTRQKISTLEEKIVALEFAIATGTHQPAIPNDAGVVQYEQVVYTTCVEKPEEAVGPERQLPPEVALKLSEGVSQLTFWKLNLKFLQSKEEALVEFFKALSSARCEFETAACEEPTRLGSGYSDYKFSC